MYGPHMTEFTPPSEDPPIGIDHPTTTLPFGSDEPEYEILVTANAKNFFDGFDGTYVGRSERMIEHDRYVNHDDIIQAIEDGIATYHDEAIDAVDPLLEAVYIRTVGDETAICLQLRSEFEERRGTSQMIMDIDEALKPLTAR